MDFLAQARRTMLADQLTGARERLIESYSGLTDEQMLEPGAAGDWSVRDILAHVAAWDRAQTSAFRAMLNGERPDLLDMDEDGIEVFNVEHHAESADTPLDEVLTELLASREEMLALLRDVSNEKLFAPAPGDEHADLSIAACVGVSASHDEEHAEMIEAWREDKDI